ncbi:Di-and tricarboxylate transporter [Brevibacterium siliguriense]|uniref:Di-and tricarboxylate transporter n=1 Tax=Brevibacterium siliguriense TaxID=1136497 RepID=A0A1H1W655_9MICO|nr:SLC13 family permease [Brevibacterium siliguriense]SDS92647.1 Di-and tricarboxylate transporter [Brevibacterium siliguriense]
MSLVQILMLVVLVVMFIAATKWPINIGIMGLVGAFVFGTFVFGMDDKEILEEFPASIVLTIVGVTFFFSIAQKNGTIRILVDLAIRAVRGRINIVPWIFFVVSSLLTAMGTFSPAAVALLAPAAMGFCASTGYSGVVMGAMVINGAHAGGFSPISVSGNIVRDIAEANGFEINGGALFLAAYVVNLLVTILTVVVMKALGRLRTVPDPDTLESWSGPRNAGSGSKEPDYEGGMPAPNSGSGTVMAVETEVPTMTSAVTPQVWLTISLIVVMVIGAVGFELPIGFLGLACGLVLAFTSLKNSENLVSGISWSTVLLVSGMIVYVSLLTHAGVIDSLSKMAVAIGAPLIVAIVLCYVIGVSSAFASSTALLTALIPMSIPLLEQSALSATAVMSALAVSATIVDVSPFSTDGALIIANTQGSEVKTIWRDLMIYAGFVVLIAPLLAWALLVPTGII